MEDEWKLDGTDDYVPDENETHEEIHRPQKGG